MYKLLLFCFLISVVGAKDSNFTFRINQQIKISKSENLIQDSAPNPYIKDWQDLADFKNVNYNYAPYSGTSKLGYRDFRIKILNSSPQFLELEFSLEIAFNGGSRIRNWGNHISCYIDGESKKIDESILLKPLSAQKAEIIFPNFPKCKLIATRDSKNLYINEQSKAENSCANLVQKCEFDAPEMNYIAQEYYKIKAGFDCQKASTNTEKAICKDADLAHGDMAINTLYLGAREALKDFILDESHIEQLPIKQNLSKKKKQKLLSLLQEKIVKEKDTLYQKLLVEQRAYLKKRESCKGNVGCIKDVLNDRVMDLIYLSPYKYIVENKLLNEPSLQKFFDVNK